METTSKEVIYVDSPSKLPPLNNIQELREPIAECHMLLPQEFTLLCIEKRGVQTNMVYHGKQVALTYEIPMAEVVLDFFDRLKSTSRGYASLDYNFKRFRASNMVRVDVLINGERVDALALITHNDNAPYRGRELVEKMKELIHASSSISRFRRLSATTLLPVPPSNSCVRTSRRNATAVTSAVRKAAAEAERR